MSKKLFGKFFIFLLVVGLLFAVAPARQAQAATLCVNTTGEGGCYTTIQAAIDAANASDTINVAAGTFTISQAINVNKSVAIEGAGIGQTVVKTAGTDSDPVSMFNVSAEGVTIKNMTIQHKKTSNTSVEAAITLSNATWPNYTPVLDFTLDSCRVEYIEFAVTLRGSHWIVSNNNFVYTGPSNNNNRVIGVYGTGGENILSKNTFVGSDDTSGKTDFVYLTSSGFNETYAGVLQLVDNEQTGGNLRHFYIQEVFSGDGLELFADGNKTTALNGNFILYGGGTTSPLDHFTTITLQNNSVSNVKGKGLLALDGDPGLKDAGRTNLVFSGNTLNNPDVTADGYAEAAGSIGGLVGYKTTVFNPFAVSDPLNTYVDDNWVSATPWTDPDGTGPATYYGYDAFATIQEAIDAAAAGATINVAAGTYAETLTINKQVTLLGPNSEINPNTGTRVGEAVIVYPAGITADKDLVYVSADGVTVAGFTIDGKDLGATLWGEGIYSEANNLTVKNNIVKNFRQIGIRAGAAYGGPYFTGALIENNKVTSDVPGIYFSYSGIYLQGTQGVVRGNVVDSANRGIQIQPYTNPATTQGIVENNSFTAYTSPLYFNYSENANSNWVFRSNVLTGIPSLTGTPVEYFAGITVETFYSGNVLFEENQVYTGTANATNIYQYYERGTVNGTRSATPNWWGSVEGPAAGQFVGNASYIPWCGDAACTTLLPAVHNVTQNKYYSTIQAAIAEAVANDVINVGAGTYNEVGQIIIDKNLTIVGADKATTIIKPAQNTGASGDARGWWLVQTGVQFKLSNVTLDGAGKLVSIGILSHGTGTIENNIIKNIGYNPSGPDYAGRGIAFYDANMTIKNNLFQNIGRIGIYMYGTGVTGAVIDGNTYEGKGAGNWLDYGIEIEGGAVAEVMNNLVKNCLGIASVDGSGSAGLLITTYWAPGSTANIQDNEFNGNDVGIYVGYDETDTSSVVAVENKLIGNGTSIVTTNPAVDGAPNWWGTAVGPQPSMYSGDVDVSSWCTNSECTLFAEAPEVTIAAVSPVVCGNTLTSTIDINVTGVPTTSPMQGYSFRLHFDTTKTSIVTPELDVVNGGFVLNGGFLVTQWIDAEGNVSTLPTNILEVAYTQFSPSTSTGNGTLASIKLTHLGVPGDIALSITDVLLSTADGYVIPSEAAAIEVAPDPLPIKIYLPLIYR